MPECVINKESVLKKIRNLDKVSGCAAYDCDEVENIILNEQEADVLTLEDHERMKRELVTQLSRTQRLTNQPGLFIPNLEMPCNCLECWFRSPFEEIGVGIGLYKKISRCWFAPEDIEDPWRDVTWQTNHREEFCPLVEMKGVRKSEKI